MYFAAISLCHLRVLADMSYVSFHRKPFTFLSVCLQLTRTSSTSKLMRWLWKAIKYDTKKPRNWTINTNVIICYIDHILFLVNADKINELGNSAIPASPLSSLMHCRKLEEHLGVTYSGWIGVSGKYRQRTLIQNSIKYKTITNNFKVIWATFCQQYS